MPRKNSSQPAEIDGAGAPGRRRKPRKGDLKEAAIIETAWRLLSEKPLSAISIEDLASGAGIHRSTFYFYFDSREAVIGALARRTIAELRQATVAVVDMTEPPEVFARLIVVGLLDRWRRQGSELRAMAAIYEQDIDVREFWDKVMEDIVASIASWIDDDRAKGLALAGPPDTKDLVRALSAMIWRSGYEMSLQPEKDADFDKLTDTLVEIAIRSLYGSTTKRRLRPSTPR